MREENMVIWGASNYITLGSTEPIDTLEQLEIMLREVGQTARGEMLRNAEYKTIVKRNVCLGTQPDQPARLGAYCIVVIM